MSAKTTLILMASLFVATVSVATEPLPSSVGELKLKDQFEVEQTVTKDTAVLLFTADKKANNIVVEALKDKQKGYLESINVKYVADISGMPSLIFSWFALPKMKKYKFSLMLGHDKKDTAHLPREKEKVGIFYLENLERQETKFVGTAKEVLEALSTLESRSADPASPGPEAQKEQKEDQK